MDIFNPFKTLKNQTSRLVELIFQHTPENTNTLILECLKQSHEVFNRVHSAKDYIKYAECLRVLIRKDMSIPSLRNDPELQALLVSNPALISAVEAHQAIEDNFVFPESLDDFLGARMDFREKMLSDVDDYFHTTMRAKDTMAPLLSVGIALKYIHELAEHEWDLEKREFDFEVFEALVSDYRTRGCRAIPLYWEISDRLPPAAQSPYSRIEYTVEFFHDTKKLLRFIHRFETATLVSRKSLEGTKLPEEIVIMVRDSICKYETLESIEQRGSKNVIWVDGYITLTSIGCEWGRFEGWKEKWGKDVSEQSADTHVH